MHIAAGSKGDDGYKEPEAEGIGLARSPSRQPDSRLRRKANGCDGGSTLLRSDGPTDGEKRGRESRTAMQRWIGSLY